MDLIPALNILNNFILLISSNYSHTVLPTLPPEHTCGTYPASGIVAQETLLLARATCCHQPSSVASPSPTVKMTHKNSRTDID